MLEHLRLVEEPAVVPSLRADMEAQDTNLKYFRELLGDIASAFGRLHGGLAELQSGVEELAKERKALPLRDKKALPVGDAVVSRYRPVLPCSAERLRDRCAGRATGF